MTKQFHIFIIFLFSIFSYGQVSILSETNTKEYEEKKAFKLNIGLEIWGNNFEQQTPVKLPDLSKFEILGNASEVFSFIDPDTGVLVRQVVYQLVLEPKQAGKIKIGSALVQVNDKIYKSEAFDIFVKETPKKENENNFWAKNIQLSMEAQNTTYYAFEPIIITLKASGKNFHNFRKINLIEFPKNQAKTYPINLQKQDIELGEMASQVIASFIIYPEKSGVYNIPPSLAKLENEKISSNSLNINIKPLPKDAPQNFKNAVGNFEIKIDKSHLKPQINQTFDIFIKLSGQGNLENIQLPKLLESADYKIINKPKKSTNFIPTNKGLKGEITEHYIIIPQKEGKIDLNIEEFSFFNPEKNQYQNISQKDTIFVHQSLEESSNNTLEELIDDTGHILKKVDLSPISQKEEDNFSWQNAVIGIFLLLFVILGIIFIKKSRRKKLNTKKVYSEKITTIAETEEILKHRLFIGKEYYFQSMKKDLEQNIPLSFFEHYDELHHDAEEQVALESNKNLTEFLESTTNKDFVREFIAFREKIQTEKYAPFHENLEDLYHDIVKFYSKIMK